MSFNKPPQVLHVLEVLSSISPDDLNDLKPHWSEVRAVFRKLEDQMRDCGPSIPTSVDSSSGCNPASRSNPRINPCFRRLSPNNAPSSIQSSESNPASSSPRVETHVPSSKPSHQPKGVSKRVTSFITKLMKDLEYIKTFVRNYNPRSTILEEHRKNIDIRVEDIVAADGTRKGDGLWDMAYLRKRLGQRSLSLEYESLLTEQSPEPTVAGQKFRSKRTELDTGRLRKASQRELECRFAGHLDTARYALRLGKKLLECEQRLGGSRFSAILIFYLADMHKKPFISSDYTDLARALESHDCLREFAEESAHWVGDWQDKYDAWCKTLNNFRDLDNEADSNASLGCHNHNHLKRPIQSDPSSQQKRQCPLPTSGEPGASGSDDGEESVQGDLPSSPGPKDTQNSKSTHPVQFSFTDQLQNQSPSHEQLRHCQPSDNQAECDRPEDASSHDGPNNTLNGSAARPAFATTALASLVPESRVNYQSPHLPLSQPGSDASPVHESHTAAHTPGVSPVTENSHMILGASKSSAKLIKAYADIGRINVGRSSTIVNTQL